VTPAGVQLPDGRTVWIDAGDISVRPLDRVLIQAAGEVTEGLIVVAPPSLLAFTGTIGGTLVDVLPAPDRDETCGDLPGADMPPLGSHLDVDGAAGTVTAVDALGRLVTVTCEDGTTEEISADRL
jgi:hypothetical protein